MHIDHPLVIGPAGTGPQEHLDTRGIEIAGLAIKLVQILERHATRIDVLSLAGFDRRAGQ